MGLFVLGFRLRGDENIAGASSYDAIVAAPDNPKVVFENEKVRVLEVTIKPGEKERFHEHSMFSVMTIFTGAPLRIMEATMKDGKLATVKTSWLTRITFNRVPGRFTPIACYRAAKFILENALQMVAKHPG